MGQSWAGNPNFTGNSTDYAQAETIISAPAVAASIAAPVSASVQLVSDGQLTL
ncbi:hypothetical protein MP228_002343 [Amoeboaphelidium protococcarum]|nr:hypothetical protein MP228_002343 [Amoeboaphelidium protococcarum]